MSCPRPGCGRPSQGHPSTGAGAHCCDNCYSPSSSPVIHSAACNNTEFELNRRAVEERQRPTRHESAVRISEDRFKAILGAPDHWKVLGARHDPWHSAVEVLFSAPELHPVGEGMEPPIITAAFCLGDQRIS